MDSIMKFGIIGAGRIAKKFAEGIKFVEDAKLVAIASRSMDRANEFGDMFEVDKRYDSYEDLAKDKEVDVIYISTPNALHKEHTILCLQNKKAVICEKPFGSNKEEVEEMIKVAKENNVFLMEAMWTRYFPVIKKVRQWVGEGRIGEVKMLQGDFGFKSQTGYEDIRFDKSLAGGSLMDVGIYPISFASMIFKEQPKEIKAVTDIGKTGVDEQAAVVFGYEGGKLALLSSAIVTETPRNVYIIGEKGYIHIPNVWYAEKAFLKIHGQEDEMIHIPMEGNGYNFEVAEVVKCLQEGKLESDIMPLKETLEIMGTMDIVRNV